MTPKMECPFPNCDWVEKHGDDVLRDEINPQHGSDLHYEREHAGRIRVQITLEVEELLGSRDPKDVRQYFMEKYEDAYHDVAYVRSEVLEESDPHPGLADNATESDGDGQ